MMCPFSLGEECGFREGLYIHIFAQCKNVHSYVQFFNRVFVHRLLFLFGKNIERAAKIVDQRGVKRIYGEPSGRSIFQVYCIPRIFYLLLLLPHLVYYSNRFTCFIIRMFFLVQLWEKEGCKFIWIRKLDEIWIQKCHKILFDISFKGKL